MASHGETRTSAPPEGGVSPAQAPHQAMIASGEPARAEEVITAPDAPAVYPPAMVELFGAYGAELSVKVDLQAAPNGDPGVDASEVDGGDTEVDHAH